MTTVIESEDLKIEEENERKNKISQRVGRDFTKSYDQILSCRHDFAHQGLRNTTVEEAFSTHTYAKRVLYAFNDAFE